MDNDVLLLCMIDVDAAGSIGTARLKSRGWDPNKMPIGRRLLRAVHSGGGVQCRVVLRAVAGEPKDLRVHKLF